MLIENHKKNIPLLIQLWKTVFSDSEEYIKLFFEKAYYDGECFGEICDGKIVSAFYLLKCKIKLRGNTYSGRYLYAAATLPEYRSKGIMSKLINEALSYGNKQGLDFIALVPADDGLYDYYGRFGFTEAMFKYGFTSVKNEALSCTLRRITDSAEFCRMRNSVNCNMLVYSDICNEYAFNCLTFAGTKIFAISPLSYYAEGEELLCGDDLLYGDDSVTEKITCESVIYTNRFMNGAKKIRNGMIYNLNDNTDIKDIYMNVALD